jgi:dTDP-4-dehydrorhamnose 3,5-epimerase-like enzyme
MVDNVYNKESEFGYSYQSFGISWPSVGTEFIISEKDMELEKY